MDHVVPRTKRCQHVRSPQNCANVIQYSEYLLSFRWQQNEIISAFFVSLLVKSMCFPMAGIHGKWECILNCGCYYNNFCVKSHQLGCECMLHAYPHSGCNQLATKSVIALVKKLVWIISKIIFLKILKAWLCMTWLHHWWLAMVKDITNFISNFVIFFLLIQLLDWQWCFVQPKNKISPGTIHINK